MDSQVALITGAGKGIGEAIALAFGAAGMRVAVAARTESDIERVAAAIRAAGGDALAVHCDVTRPDSIANAVAAVRREFGPIGVLVNNAGAGESHKFIGHDDHVCRAVVPMMVEAKWGRIINIASVASKVGMKFIVAYTAAKHGVLGLTRALAVELVAHNITVNAICPGYVDTPLTDRTIANITTRTRMSAADARAVLERESPQNRLITSEEVAHVALMLAADNARGITGQAINVDGGQVMY
jgi:NAD(P)-dependent dehydrogenase (short-subunit alcohol dehydrogenase family)